MWKRSFVLLAFATLPCAAAAQGWRPETTSPQAPSPQPVFPQPVFPQAAPQRVVNGPKNFFGQKHPGKLTSLSDDGVAVTLKEGGAQVVQLAEIWRLRRAFASDEPPGASVIDFANNRLFVATPLAELVENLGKKVAITKLTAPNGETIYMVASKVTDISRAIPGLHNPESKAVVGTRDGTQQVSEAIGDAQRLVSEARVTP
jgi:hypothetical protein